MVTKQRWIKVLGGFEGLHHWPEAKNYLKHLHRHWFGITLWLEVKHDDREVEFYDLKDLLKGWIDQIPINRHNVICSQSQNFMEVNWSCEMIADCIAEYCNDVFPGRQIKIEVTEDNLEGTLCEYNS